MSGVRVRECSLGLVSSNVWGYGQGVLQCLGLGSGSAPMFGVRVREWSPMSGVRVRCSSLGLGSAPMFGVRGSAPMFGVRVGVLQCLGLGSGSAPMFGVRVRECSNVWG